MSSENFFFIASRNLFWVFSIFDLFAINNSLPLPGELDNRTDELHETITEAEQGHDDVKRDGTPGQHEGGGEGDHAKDDEDGAEDHLQNSEVLDVVCHREDIQSMGLNKFLKKEMDWVFRTSTTVR
jgi:hypothetical protein